MKGRWKHRPFFVENARCDLLNDRIESANLLRMSDRRMILFTAIFVLATVMIESRRADASSELRVDELFSVLRDGKFRESTAHFDHTMRAGLSADELAALWLKIVADNGKFESWKVIGRDQTSGIDVFAVELTFEHGKEISTVSVRPETDEIAGLYFKPLADALTASPPATSPPYADAAKFSSEEVTVGDAPWKLPGTLTIPASSGPFPAVVLLAGSGPNDRDETIGPNHPFADLAEGLSSRGIAVLRYDKRTHAYRGALDPQKITVDEEVIQDGVAAVSLMRARPEVAQDKIFVVGHSLGAMLAPEIAKKARPVAGIVMLAPLGREAARTIVEQMRFLGQVSPEKLAEIERQADEISAHKMPASEKSIGAPASYFYDLDARDEVAIARNLSVPIFILHGGRDYQVIDEDIQHWQDGLKGVANVKVETFPALNHLFIAGEGKPNPAEYGTPGHVDQAVIDAITNFVENSGAKK